MNSTQIAVRNSRALQMWSLLLPILKCALCPVCLGLYSGLFAGARVAFLGNESVHGALFATVVVVDVVVLWAAAKHHQRVAPLVVCVVGAGIALLGHWLAEIVEYVGFGLLLFAALWNVRLMRRAHRNDCCVSDRCKRSSK